MSKLYVLAGGMVEPGGAAAGGVGALVAYGSHPGVSGAGAEPKAVWNAESVCRRLAGAEGVEVT